MKERDISNAELAKIMNVTPQYISEVVNERKNISITVLAKFAKVLQVPMAALVDGYHEKEQLGHFSFNCPYCGKVIKIGKTK
ncbi:MAG: helix-turn-helix transcriptional regulator [Bacteroidaceae bacterium]|nr:helix-turn-helix transcriptional regulator [Bacteroidaceae bacterium]